MTARIPILALLLALAASLVTGSQERRFPPALPGGRAVITESSEALLEPPAQLKGVSVATRPPTVDMLYYPGQDYPGRPWSAWGDGLAVGEHYFSSIGDHGAPEGNAFVYDYDSARRRLRRVVDVRRLLGVAPGRYTPGKIHSRIDLGSDGWLYFATHRGGTRATERPESHFLGDWILRYHPGTGKAEVVAAAPVARRNLPASVLDPDRLLFYAGASDGLNEKPPCLLVYDLGRRRARRVDPKGPYRCLFLSRKTGRVYFHTAKEGPADLYRYDPRTGSLTRLSLMMGVRAATQESSAGIVYTVEANQLWAFDTRTETARRLGEAAVGEQTYIASLDLDPRTERYLYYVAGAHGGSYRDGSPVVQYNLQTRARKVIAFLHPCCEKFGWIPLGTYASAVSPGGDKLYITWNAGRVGEAQKRKKKPSLDSCALTVIHIPESERR